MRFTTQDAHAIFEGTKTEIRVPMARTCRVLTAASARSHVTAITDTGQRVYRAAPYTPGETHRIQRPRHAEDMTPLERLRFDEAGKRGWETIGRLTVLAIGAQFLADITIAQARAEGHRSRADFARRWMGFPADDTSSDEDVLEVFAEVHADTPVWVLTVAPVVAEQPRSLGVKAVGYTADGQVEPEPEPVDDAALREIIVANAGKPTSHWQGREREHRDRDRHMLEVEQAIVLARRLAQMSNVNISQQIWRAEKVLMQGRPEAARQIVGGAQEKIARLKEAA